MSGTGVSHAPRRACAWPGSVPRSARPLPRGPGVAGPPRFPPARRRWAPQAPWGGHFQVPGVPLTPGGPSSFRLLARTPTPLPRAGHSGWCWEGRNRERTSSCHRCPREAPRGLPPGPVRPFPRPAAQASAERPVSSCPHQTHSPDQATPAGRPRGLAQLAAVLTAVGPRCPSVILVLPEPLPDPSSNPIRARLRMMGRNRVTHSNGSCRPPPADRAPPHSQEQAWTAPGTSG